jgi:predicted MFS family arabinose efflux permease
MLVSADLIRALLLASVPVARVLGLLTMAQLYAVAALAGTAAVVFNVGASGVVPALVAADQRVEANALLRGSFAFSWAAGPSAGGLLVQLVTAPIALVFDAGSFLVSAALIRTLRLRSPDDGGGTEGGVAAGLRFIARHPILGPYAACGTLLNLGYMTYFTLLIPFAVRELHLTPGQVGLAVGAGSVGGLAGSLVTARVTRRLGLGRALILGSLVYAAPLLAIPLAPRHAPWVACATIAAAELVSALGLVLDDVNGLTLQQTVTPEPLLGRVSGANMAGWYGARALAGLAAAGLGSALGLAPTIALAAAVGVLSVLFLIASPVRGTVAA